MDTGVLGELAVFRDLELQFMPWISSPTVRLGVAFAALIIVTLLLGGMVNYILIQLIERIGLLICYSMWPEGHW
ncbi:MAG: hypothetical protein AAF669_00450 [Pseudomonadota bacterium]